MSKGQGLPMTAIAIIIIILITVVGVILFFFTSFGQGQAGTETMNCQQKCSTIEVIVKTNNMVLNSCGSGSEICGMDKVDNYTDSCSGVKCEVNDSHGNSCDITNC